MSKYDVVGIGNAIVDVICESDDGFLGQMNIEKGIMQLVERERAQELYGAMNDRVQTPGGSVANTIAGIGALGASTAFIGRVCDDGLGQFYADAMANSGTDFVNAPVAGDFPTSRSMIFVSPDGERSMNTYLGISAELGPDDVSPAVAENAKLLFIEGYLYDKPEGKAALQRAAELTRAAGGKAGVTLSDPFCVERHRDDFLELAAKLDLVIGNEQEWEALYQTDLESALDQAAQKTPIVVCTRGGEDVIIRAGAERFTAPVKTIDPVDTTGAGDQFAAGFLYGLSLGKPLEICGHMGAIAATEVIGHIGPRPQRDISELFRKAGLV